jgi:tRNA A22 N-methylase
VGCDHGLLGLSFAFSSRVKEIHFVDPSLAVMERLRFKLNSAYIPIDYFFHKIEGQGIKFESPATKTIFIAGMGGREIGLIIAHLLPQLGPFDQLVISPHRSELQLRQHLSIGPLRLAREEVVFEDNLFYQVLDLRLDPGLKPVSRFGDHLWETTEGRAYRAHLLRHFALHRDEASKQFVAYLLKLGN